MIDPSHNGRSSGRPCPYVASNACASIGSPSTRTRAMRLDHVDVGRVRSPRSRAPGESPAAGRDHSARSTRCSPHPGSPRCPARAPTPGGRYAAHPRGAPTPAHPHPRPNPVPSAASANDLHRPSGARPRCRRTRRTAPASPSPSRRPPAPASTRPARSASHARCNATSEEEHAVSTVTAGPSSPNVYATRPEATLAEMPVSQIPLQTPRPPDSMQSARSPARTDPGEHTRLAAPQRAGVDTRILERLPAGFQQQPLLRIHRQRLARD